MRALSLLVLCVLSVDACPEPDKVLVQLFERGTTEKPRNDTICDAEGWLLNSNTEVLQAEAQNVAKSSLVELSCEGSECEPSQVSEHDWVAILHYPDVNALTHTTVIDQMRQAILWGASAVLMLAINAETLKKVEIDRALSKPVIIISANITKILKALANSTRVLVAISCKPLVSSQLTLTLWATCGRMSSRTLSEDEQPFPWEGTVCMDVPAGKSNPSELWAMFYAGLLIVCLLILLKSGRPDGITMTMTLRRQLLERAQQQRRRDAQEALSMIPCVRYESVPRVMRSLGLEYEETCAICLEDYCFDQVLRYLPCRHTFHRYCVDPWLIEHCTCPLCKRCVME